MTLIEQAHQLLKQSPYTIQTCREFAQLEQQARGEEANQIADLLPALISGLDQETHLQAFNEELV